MATTIRAIYEWAADYDSKLRADDERFQRSVLVIHEEGTVMTVMSAFLVELDEQWVIMFSEHQSFHVWHKDDLAGAIQFAHRGAPDPISLKAAKPKAKQAKSRAR